MLFYGAALVACPAVADETTILFNVTIAYILYFYVCLMYNKAIKQCFIIAVVIGWETNNKYQIKNSLGQQVYFAAEGAI